ncbi:hypothetical protein L593_01765 [Salinarchaeum sp. Harcht-Bsk1]|uniref:DUF6276 family protein n=1 Tax=Salinarchaeum sp. Harcht-Bsk1 TaxID=1333523 RepID=UPI0003422C5E|nr:DUF6276 family protein [Salinarchaeum sp. Harcht-Bsk1]AGN00304.1 hypothetical protein L593_01765 [Salinarchaeum sp. Harcht-Bsk1]
MSCTRCDEPTVDLVVPESLQPYAQGATVSVCTNCLTVEAGEGGSGHDLDAISEDLPEGDAGVGTLLLVDLLDSLATNRADIEGLIDEIEADGADPMLALDRLANDPGLDPAVDIDRRRTQLEQLVL